MNSLQKNSPLPRVESIAGLKALACILVLLHHISYFYSHVDTTRTFLTFGDINLYPFLVNGWIGWYIFFAICGYFTMRSWWGNPKRNYKEYAVSRFRRIMPIYYFLMVVYLFHIMPDYVTPFPPNLPSVVYHVLMLPDIFLPDIMVMFATVAAEVKIFLILPFIFLSCLKHKKTGRALLFSMIFLVVVGFLFRVFGYSKFYLVFDYYQNYYQFFLHTMAAFVYCLDPVVCGIGVAYLEFISRKRKTPIISTKMAKVIFFGGMSALAVWLYVTEHLLVITFYDAAFQPILIGLITGSLLLGAAFGGAPKVFSGNFAQNTGRLSYAAYLVHIPLIATSYRIVYIAPNNGQYHLLDFFYIVISFFILVWIASEFLQRYVEEPFVRNIRRYR